VGLGVAGHAVSRTAARCKSTVGRAKANSIPRAQWVGQTEFTGRSRHGLSHGTPSADLRWQGPTQYENSSLVEQDPHGLGAAVARRLLDELEHLGADFIAAYVVQGIEETFYHSIGLKKNAGHLVCTRDRRS
jgi:hypothetical protein